MTGLAKHLPTPEDVAGWHETLAETILDCLVPDESMPTGTLPHFEDWLQTQALMHRNLARYIRTLS